MRIRTSARHVPSRAARAAICMALAIALCAPAGAQTPPRRDDMAAFPAARAGEVRHVIRLAAAPDETALRVGVVVGRTMMIDCNGPRLSSTLEERTAKGWGYSYFVVTRVGPGVSTMMACPTKDRRRAFVRSSDEPLLRYNSRLPLVIYAPTDVEVRYRIWRAGPEQIPGRPPGAAGRPDR